MKRFLFGVALVGLLALSWDRGTAQTVQPTFGNWRWPQVLQKINELEGTIGSTCRLWIETYSTNSYRVWKRCGVDSTASGAVVHDYTLPNAVTGSSTGIPCPGACTRVVKNGDGSLSFLGSAGVPVGATSLASNLSGSMSGGGVTLGTSAAGVKNNYALSCVGSIIPGGTVGEALDASIWWTSLVGSYVRDTSTAANSISATCKNADSLVIDFGNVATDCENSWLVTGRINGRPIMSGSCDCIPRGHGVDAVTAGPVCSYVPITGDPAASGDGSSSPGTYNDGPGHTYTNEDLASNGGEIPTIGDGSSGGISPGYGGTGTSEGQTPTAGTGTGTGGSPGSGSSGGGGGGGDGPPCTDPACEGKEGGVVPGVPTYNTDLDPVTEDSWVDALTGWASGNPLSSLLGGAGISTSSASCTISGGSIKGASLTWDLCNIPGLDLFPPVLLALAHLCAIFIVFRR